MKKSKLGYIEFLQSTFGNDEGDVVPVELVTDAEYYYTDGFCRWCYIEKDSKYIRFFKK